MRNIEPLVPRLSEVDGPATARRGRRLRTRRLRAEALAKCELVVRVLDPTSGVNAASLIDLAARGMAISVGASDERAFRNARLLRVGDRIDELSVISGNRALYCGAASVRHVTQQLDALRVGLELDGPDIDLAELYRLDDRMRLTHRLSAAEAEAHVPGISVEFKAWVADLRAYLDTIKRCLDEEEARLGKLDRATRNEVLDQYLHVVGPLLISGMMRAREELGRLVSDLTSDAHALHRAFLSSQLSELIRLSPFIRRARDKPLGYAGDYEMMNMLYRDHAEGDTLFGKALNLFVAQEPAARAVVNRVDYLGRLIRSAAERTPGRRIRIASLGCGPAREILRLLQTEPELGPRIEVALIDQESEAIRYCERSLSPVAAAVGARVDYIQERVRHLLLERELGRVLGARDLVFSAGLFDYLGERMFSALLGALYSALAPGGTLAVGNMADHNPSRWFMEYYLDWFLIHRSRDELLRLGAQLAPLPSSVTVDAEPLGVNLFLLVQR
jgi:extracellular factor (EF) 3-hydroxypalmitic acid methyl ester biosynthesis protein